MSTFWARNRLSSCVLDPFPSHMIFTETYLMGEHHNGHNNDDDDDDDDDDDLYRGSSRHITWFSGRSSSTKIK